MTAPNAPATARSVYVIEHPAARPTRHAPHATVWGFFLETLSVEGVMHSEEAHYVGTRPRAGF